MNTSIFKSYDIRGIYPDQLDEEAAYKIGRAFVHEFKLKKVAIGRDARESSTLLFESLSQGILDSGADVIDLGMTTTPMVYFATANLDIDGAISLTASHNPAKYNGFKLNLAHAVPVGSGSGMEEVRERADQGNYPEVTDTGSLSTHSVTEDYLAYIASFAKFSDKKFKIVIDCGNGMGSLDLPIFEALKDSVEVHPLFETLDMTFPNHEANPLDTTTLNDLSKKVIELDADLGIAFDGDADRAGFVDELGKPIRMDTITSLLSQDILSRNKGATILYDLRSSDAVKETIEAAGGKAVECRVGHAHIKKDMRLRGATFAGELSGHYYFKENSFGESASLAAILLLNTLADSGKTLSETAQAVEKYFQSGEINSEVSNTEETVKKLAERYSDGEQSELDGLKVRFADWWFNVRASNTEPVLRLNVEAHTEDMLEAKTAELLKLIRG